MHWLSTVLVATLLGFAMAGTTPVGLYAHKVGDHAVRIPLGTVLFNETSGLARVELASVPFEEGVYSIGAETPGGGMHRHGLTYLTFPLQHTLTLLTKQDTGELISLSLSRGTIPGVVGTTIKSVPRGAQVSLARALPAPGAKLQSKEGAGAGAVGVEEEEEPDNRSFIQKYWFYIVPVLLLMVSRSG
jgi:hypothetical protein